MAEQLNGYAIVPHASYNEFRTYLTTHGVNVDYTYGNQCWDSCALLWYQYGLRLQTGNGYAYGCWTIMRDSNAIPPFIPIFNIGDIKRGDVVVFNRFGSVYTGHIGFADEDYNGSGEIKILGQNQGQGTGPGTASIVTSWSTTNILGAFRNTNWLITPPTPEPFKKKDKGFNWVIFNRLIKPRR